MKSIQSLWCCAVVALLVASPPVRAQDDPFGENPFGDRRSDAEVASPIDRSMLAGKPAVADETVRDFCQCVGESRTESVAGIEQALRSPLTRTGLDFTDAPLEEVVAFLQETYNVPVQLDTPALDEIGIGPDEPVSVNLHEISLRSALRLMLKQLQLTYIIRDEVLMITTPEEAESQLLTCVYDVRDIVNKLRSEPPKGAVSFADFDPLVDVLTSCVRKETWAESGGAGDLRPLKSGLLVISQTQAVHEEIRGLLETIKSLHQHSPAAAEAGPDKSAAAEADSNQVVTRAYFLSIGQPAADAQAVRKQVYELITHSFPDEKFQRRLDDGQPVVLTILPDRVVLRHTPEVQQKVEALLVDSGVTAPPAQAAGMGGRGGGFGGGGGGGGGFFRPRPGEND